MMQSVHQLSPDGGGNKGRAESNYHTWEENKEIRDGVVGEGQGLSEEGESRINGRGEITRPLHEVGTQKAQLPHQQPLGTVVRWERFLPLRSLKVLLVENDDSTRQVVGALLRNCSYDVTAAANGSEAWKILEDLANPVDLVLTEVVMPLLSGIGLLCKIMGHKTRKNVPVIMMSSHDSVGVVFQCLSKGAVDFLVKPIRKNELKNLWQHIWRRCHSSSGSGSESGIQAQKSVKSKSVEDSDNNSGSNDEDDNASMGLNVRDGSDNGSGTQSSWTKHAAEVSSPQPSSPWDQLDHPHNSTCVQVIHQKTETFCNEWVPMTRTEEYQDQKELLDKDFMGKDLEIGQPRQLDFQSKYLPDEKASTNLTGLVTDRLSKGDSLNKDNRQLNDGQLEHEGSNVVSEQGTQAADLIGAITKCADEQMVIRIVEASDGHPKISEGKDVAADDVKEMPSLELSLKRLRSIGEGGITTHDDQNVLKRSDLSAFSRYNNKVVSTQAPTDYGGSCSLPLDNSSKAMKMESICILSNANAPPLNQGSNGSSNNNDMGSTSNNAFTKPVALKEKPASTSVKGHRTSAFYPVQQTGANQQVIQEKKIDGVAAAGSEEAQTRGSHHEVQVQHHHHHYHHHHHHVHSRQQQQQQLQLPPDQDELSLKNMAAASPQCGSSSMYGGPVEGNAGNYIRNGSNSGSNHGSNGQNGSSTAALNAGAVNMESDNMEAGKGGVGGGNVSGSGSGSGNGVDQNRFAQRVAALTKFRQKRKDRCFEKKVRYQSRKKLAEQRPRVRGQFVRQTEHESRNWNADC